MVDKYRLAWQQISSTVISDMLCHNLLDGVVLDTEHGCFSNESLYCCIQIITANDKKCFVRLTEVSKTMIRMCLDAGAHGIIFSTVEEEDQARDIFEMCKYPSHGGKRGLGLVRQNRWGARQLVSDPPIIIAQIETEKGVDNLNNLLKYDFDYYMIGPYDLSASLGAAGLFDDERYLSAVDRVKELVPIQKMAVHIPKDVTKHIKKYEEYGIIAIGMDTTILLDGYNQLVEV